MVRPVLALGALLLAVGCSGKGDGDHPEPAKNGVRRFFADSASWNRPISELGASTRFAGYETRFYDWAGGPHIETRGHYVPKFVDYSVPIYDAKAATTTARTFQVLWSQNQQSLGNAPIGTSIPWNPDWQPGTGNDRIMAVVDYGTGKVWELWVVGEPPANCSDVVGPNAQAGFDPNDPNDLCIAGLNTYDNLWTATDGTTINVRGAGINKLIGVTRADEVASGAIRHVLELTTTDSMFGGPLCNPPNDGSAVGAGTDCGFYLPPATRVEWSQGAPTMCGAGNYPDNTPQGRALTIPEGMRFGIHITDAEIGAWLDSRSYTGPKRETARVFAVAWRDYGAIPMETGCYGVGIETDGIVNPTSRATWESLGITGTVATGNNPEADLLDGLVTPERLYVVDP